LDIGPGDEVILPPFTFFATVGSVVRCGAKPVFADIDPLTFNLDPAAVAAAVTPRTRAILPVHLFGQSAALTDLMQIAQQAKAALIEDAAQAWGAEYRGKKVGSLGEIGCFSFYPSKNLGTAGDGGLVSTNDDYLAKKLLALRNHGSEQKYFHKYIGWNGRLDAIHAAILRVKLPHVESWLSGRAAAGSRYDRLIEEAGLHSWATRPPRGPHGHTFNQYVIRVPAVDRDRLKAHLLAEGISCDIYYPLCLHQQECLKHFGHQAGDFPEAERAAAQVLALPIFAEITTEQQQRVVASLERFARPAGIRKAG
jgi:dTDP-4-amino-4,6-dideoxygalactose transaminase